MYAKNISPSAKRNDRITRPRRAQICKKLYQKYIKYHIMYMQRTSYTFKINLLQTFLIVHVHIFTVKFLLFWCTRV